MLFRSAKYIVTEIRTETDTDGIVKTIARIKNTNGREIALNDTTAPNRVMVLGLEDTVKKAREQEAAAKVVESAQPKVKEIAEKVKETVKETAKKEAEKKTEQAKEVVEKVTEKVKRGNKKAWAIAAGAIAIAGIGYGIHKKHKNKNKKELNIVV